MLEKITLVDIQGKLIQAWIKYQKNTNIPINILKQDISAIPLDTKTAFVSPANSLGFMNDGVDAVYTDMFPNIEQKVKNEIRQNGKLSILRRRILEIGNALIVPTGFKEVYMISAPTMFIPTDVSETHNAYHATYAAIKEGMKKDSITHLIIPGMGTCTGKIPYEKAANQMWDAISDAISNKPAKYNINEIVNEQPAMFKMREYFESYGAFHKTLKI